MACIDGADGLDDLGEEAVDECAIGTHRLAQDIVAEDKRIGYPESALAREHGAEAPEPTTDPKAAYADVPSWGPTETPDWPPDR